MNRIYMPLIAATLITVAALGGCQKKAPPVAAMAGKGAHADAKHEHDENVVELGKRHHAKMTIEAGGVVKLVILGEDGVQVTVIEKQTVQGKLKAAGDAEATPITLETAPQPGDPAEKTSQFKGILPEKLRGKTITAAFDLTVWGEPFRPVFSAESNGHDAHDSEHKTGNKEGGIPEKDRLVFLTPGGIYTAADIAANGNTTPGVKFKDIDWDHGKPAAGDKVCPVTDNKADPKCNWVIGGKSYEFCCTPCVRNFVELAKKEPAKIKKPEEYIQK